MKTLSEQRYFYVVAFDVSEDIRETKIALLLEEYGVKVQKTVFEICVTSTDIEYLIQKLQILAGTEEGNIRLYPIIHHTPNIITINSHSSFCTKEAWVF